MGGYAPTPAPTAERSLNAPAELVNRIERHLTTHERYQLVRSVIALADGLTVLKRYYQTSASQSHDIQHVTGTVVSTLVGSGSRLFVRWPKGNDFPHPSAGCALVVDTVLTAPP